MSYFNPLLKFGIDKIFKQAQESGFDGILIVDLPLEQKYILRLVGGSYKYMGKDAYKTLLEIFAKLSPILKTNLIEDAKAGKLINEDSARIIRKSVQALFVNETDCKYPRKLL